MSSVVYVVTERSAVGETVLGVFSTLEEARRVVPTASSRLQDYHIQGHVLGASPDPRTPWSVVLSRDGSVEAADMAVT